VSNFRVTDDIVSIAHFKTHASALVRRMRAERSSFVVTLSGRPAAVVMTPEEFDRLEARANVLTSIHEGLASARQRTFTPEQVRARALKKVRGRPGAR
jgi:prevent-host-death family protein